MLPDADADADADADSASGRGRGRDPGWDRGAVAEEPSYTLVGRSGRSFRSTAPGTFGGHRRSRLYGRLDCPSALRVIARGGYVRERVFFRDEFTAVAAGYRPCSVCLPEQYRRWKSRRENRDGREGRERGRKT